MLHNYSFGIAHFLDYAYIIQVYTSRKPDTSESIEKVRRKLMENHYTNNVRRKKLRRKV